MKNRAPKPAVVGTAFWDTSALVPLCCVQRQSSRARRAARLYGQQIVWWGTPVEAVSTLARLGRGGEFTLRELSHALARLEYLRSHWHEIQPGEQLRTQAERLLRVHPMRAADALQLAAALVWCNHNPRNHHLVSADDVLSNAAETEGFSVVAV